MRLWAVFLLLLASCALTTLAVKKGNDRCSSWYSALFSECHRCPHTAHPIENLERLLRERVYGQPEAINTIVAAFKTHDSSKPLTFHIAGDNGVGKTYTAKTIAEAVFLHGDPVSSDFDGLLYLRGEQYEGRENAAAYRTTITSKIMKQLSSCPNSLIVIDEAEYLAPETISAFTIFMDDTVTTFEYGGYKCKTNEATFIVISDFGAQGRTAGMTFQEIKSLTEQDTKRFWISHKSTGVITHVVPFVPFTPEVRRKAVEAKLRSLAHLEHFVARHAVVEFDDAVVDAASARCDEIYKDENGRGVVKYVESDVVPELLSAITDWEAKRGPINKDGNKALVLRLRVSNKNGQAFAVEVFDRPRKPLGTGHREKDL